MRVLFVTSHSLTDSVYAVRKKYAKKKKLKQKNDSKENKRNKEKRDIILITFIC